MRGKKTDQNQIFSYVSLEERIPQRHPLRQIRKIVDTALAEMSDVFDDMYAAGGRPSIPPEQLIRAMPIQILFSIRSERLLMEELDFNLLFRWFVGLSIDDSVWNQAAAKKLLSRHHFTVDGTLIEASASLKSFRPKDESDDDTDDTAGGGGSRNQERDFHGEKRSNDTHESKTDPDSRLARKGKGKEARLSYSGHILTENRHGLIVNATVNTTTGTAEREAAIKMISQLPGTDRKTLGADKGYDTVGFVEARRAHEVTPHVAQKKYSALDERTTRHPGYRQSLKRRKMVEERFGWMKDFGLLRKLRHRGLEKVGWIFKFTAAACNIAMMRRLMEETA